MAITRGSNYSTLKGAKRPSPEMLALPKCRRSMIRRPTDLKLMNRARRRRQTHLTAIFYVSLLSYCIRRLKAFLSKSGKHKEKGEGEME